MVTNTDNYAFHLPSVGGDEDAWGGYLNENWTMLDTILFGGTALPLKVASGTINDTPIGATTKSTGAFTTLEAMTSLKVGPVTLAPTGTFGVLSALDRIVGIGYGAVQTVGAWAGAPAVAAIVQDSEFVVVIGADTPFIVSTELVEVQTDLTVEGPLSPNGGINGSELLGGFTAASVDDGAKTSGMSYTPSPVGGNFKHITTAGNVTIGAPTAAGVYTLLVEVVLAANSALTLSGFTKVNGDPTPTVSGRSAQLSIAKTNNACTVVVVALQ